MSVLGQSQPGVANFRVGRLPLCSEGNRRPFQRSMSRPANNSFSLSAMERPKSMGEQYRHNQDARPEGEHMRGAAQIEAADPTDEQISNGEIEKAPKDVDQGRGQADSRRRCERALERVPGNPIAEMGHGVRKECTAEEVRDIMVPAHFVVSYQMPR
jgi:hypothetical protein